ncbi:hypothetical protein BGX29_011044 [Mortierella sp. GBA35]|nr:hypothetical protein BGX29_011044 [Mortierella sp. GBA35]
MTPNAQLHSVVDRIPAEIVLAFAQYLDKPSLFKALKVCRRWSEILGHLAWSSISKVTWHYPYFPIQQQGENSYFDDSNLAPFLYCVKSLEWHSNQSLIPTEVVSEPQTQIPTTRLAHILGMTLNLTTLSLRMVDDNPDPSLFQSMCDLKHLKRLDISLPARPFQVPIETMFPLFVRLNELNIDGPWYVSNENNTNAVALSHPQPKERWSIRQLTIDSYNAALIQHCPDLEELRLFHPRFCTIAQEHASSEAISRKLQEPTASLKTVEIYSALRAASYSFKVHDPSAVDPFTPYLLLCREPQEWWSTRSVAALF